MAVGFTICWDGIFRLLYHFVLCLWSNEVGSVSHLLGVFLVVCIYFEPITIILYPCALAGWT